MSKREQRRAEFLEKNEERVERLLLRFGDSEKVLERITELEKGIKSGKELKELEALHGQYKLLKEYERVNGKRKREYNERGEEVKDVEEELYDKSGFFDEELNPSGKDVRGVNVRWRVREFQEPFEQNAEGVPMPLEDKPKYYRMDGYGVYGG